MIDNNLKDFSSFNMDTQRQEEVEVLINTLPSTTTFNTLTNLKMNGSSKIHQNHNDDLNKETDSETTCPLLYKLTDTPPPIFMITLALQQGLLAIATPLTTVFIVGEIICAGDDDVIKARILSATFFMIGLSTFTMATFGVRLPVFQGPNFTYVLPLLSMLSLKEFQCPAPFQLAVKSNITYDTNATTSWFVRLSNNDVVSKESFIHMRINELAGSLILVGAIHFMCGLTGIVGFLKRFVGPITLVPLILLFGIQINPVVVDFSKSHWGISMFTSAVAIILALYLRHYRTPIPSYTRVKRLHITWRPLHTVFACFISIVLGWILCLILTVSGALSNDPRKSEYLSRTDSRFDVIDKMDWFVFPYPGQFGSPSINISAVITFLVATIMSVVDSIGNYSATARVAYAPQPPHFALNRGVAIEGIMVMLGGAFGCGHGTVAFNENIGAMTLSRCVSRNVFQLCGLMYMVFAFLGKVGAFAITIPHPVMGGVQLITFGILIGVILAYLQFIDLNSTRNLSILGISILLGTMMETFVKLHQDEIQTGIDQLDFVLKIFMANPGFVGSGFACFLDNTVPGSIEERGMNIDMMDICGSKDKRGTKYDNERKDNPSRKGDNSDSGFTILHGREVYRLPWIPDCFRKWKIVRFFPIIDTRLK